MSTIMNIVNVATTPASFIMVEKLGRRTLLIYGAIVMCVCEFLVAIIGVTKEGTHAA